MTICQTRMKFFRKTKNKKDVILIVSKAEEIVNRTHAIEGFKIL